jgi:hypothetical protein
MKRILIVCMGMAFLFGCTTTSRFEYRYRVFYGLDLPAKETLSSEEFSRLFYPLGSLNRSLDLFGEEGFTLHDYSRLGESQNYIFVFRRLKKKGELVQRPSRRFEGVYQIDRENSKILLAVVSPPEGAQVVDLEGIKKIHQAQTGDNQVIYETPEGRVILSFSPDGTVEFNIETISGNTTVTKKYQGQKYGQTATGSN